MMRERTSAVEKTLEMFDKFKLPQDNGGLDQTIKLMLFNRFNGNDKDRFCLDPQINRLNFDENCYQHNPYITTIGTELECPEEFLDSEKRDVLNQLDIPNKFELNNFDPMLWEVMPGYSHCYKTQQRILYELVKFGAVRKDEKGNIPHGDYSLHINFGVPFQGGCPHDISVIKFNLQNDIEVFMKAINYAFTSPERIIKRGVDRFYKVTNDDVKKPFLCRIESTATELNEFTDITLKISQLVCSALLKSTNQHYGLPLDSRENSMLDGWRWFRSQCEEVFSKCGVDCLNLERKHTQQNIEALKNTNLSEDIKSLLFRFSKKLKSVIKK